MHFGDASTQEIGAAVYSVIRKPSGVTQRLVAAKARQAKQGLTVIRLELVSAHAATNLVVNVSHALQGRPQPMIYRWLYRTGYVEMDDTINLWGKRLENIQRCSGVMFRLVRIRLI